MVLRFIALLFLFVFSYPTVATAQEYNHGITGTLNHDYFDPDPTNQMLRANVDVNHTKPLMDDLRAGMLDNALAEIKYILERFPNHAKALMLISSVAKLKKSPMLGVPYFERAIKLFPQYALTHAQYGNYLVEVGSVKAGVARLEKATAMDPQLKPARLWLARAYAKSGKGKPAQ